MKINKGTIDLDTKIISSENILFIQDIDGVCIPLVKDPMTRKIDERYIYAVKNFNEEFFVLTCGEHEGERGVNRIIEKALKNNIDPQEKGLYFPGLAACGVEFQNINGEISFEGISDKEIQFLSIVPKLIRPKFTSKVKEIFPNMNEKMISYHTNLSICNTRFSPTINFNSLFEIVGDNWRKRKEIQKSFEIIMNEIIYEAELRGLKDSFFLHISPNLGTKHGIEIIKGSTPNDIGSTDIQFLLKGALKDSGVLCLLNKFIETKKGFKPFGEKFNFRNSPKSIKEKIDLCKKYIKREDMPLIIGVGDTITSQKDISSKRFLRGGSDRSFLELIKLLGEEYEIENKIIFVDSSSGEVFRPSTKETGFEGITDKNDFLKFDLVFQNGPKEYIDWFIKLSKRRKELKD